MVPLGANNIFQNLVFVRLLTHIDLAWHANVTVSVRLAAWMQMDIVYAIAHHKTNMNHESSLGQRQLFLSGWPMTPSMFDGHMWSSAEPQHNDH